MSHIRQASLTDVPALLPLYEELGYVMTEGELSEQFRQLLTHPDYGFLVIEQDGTLLGFLGYAKLYYFEQSGHYYRILALVVAERARRQGVATQLLDALKAQALTGGASALALNSGARAERQPAHAFYQNYGFSQSSLGFGLALKEDNDGMPENPNEPRSS